MYSRVPPLQYIREITVQLSRFLQQNLLMQKPNTQNIYQGTKRTIYSPSIADNCALGSISYLARLVLGGMVAARPCRGGVTPLCIPLYTPLACTQSLVYYSRVSVLPVSNSITCAHVVFRLSCFDMDATRLLIPLFLLHPLTIHGAHWVKHNTTGANRIQYESAPVIRAQSDSTPVFFLKLTKTSKRFLLGPSPFGGRYSL